MKRVADDDGKRDVRQKVKGESLSAYDVSFGDIGELVRHTMGFLDYRSSAGLGRTSRQMRSMREAQFGANLYATSSGVAAFCRNVQETWQAAIESVVDGLGVDANELVPDNDFVRKQALRVAPRPRMLTVHCRVGNSKDIGQFLRQASAVLDADYFTNVEKLVLVAAKPRTSRAEHEIQMTVHGSLFPSLVELVVGRYMNVVVANGIFSGPMQTVRALTGSRVNLAVGDAEDLTILLEKNATLDIDDGTFSRVGRVLQLGHGSQVIAPATNIGTLQVSNGLVWVRDVGRLVVGNRPRAHTELQIRRIEELVFTGTEMSTFWGLYSRAGPVGRVTRLPGADVERIPIEMPTDVDRDPYERAIRRWRLERIDGPGSSVTPLQYAELLLLGLAGADDDGWREGFDDDDLNLAPGVALAAEEIFRAVIEDRYVEEGAEGAGDDVPFENEMEDVD